MPRPFSFFFLKSKFSWKALNLYLFWCIRCQLQICLAKHLFSWPNFNFEFNFEPSLKLRWFRPRDLFGSQIPVTTGRFELPIFSMRNSYLTQYAISYQDWTLRTSGLLNYFECKRFTVQTLLWSLEFVIQMRLEQDTIAIYLVFLFWLQTNIWRIPENIYLLKLNNKNTKKERNILKSNNKETRATLLMSFGCLYC